MSYPQEDHGVWDDMSPEFQETARMYLGALGDRGMLSHLGSATPGFWGGLIIILGMDVCQRLNPKFSTNLRVNPDFLRKDPL